ncbi:MAG: ribbon-helix-helix protein, CopG family [Nanoarchaeota archaeon]
MKHKMSITLDEDLIHKILQAKASNRMFRSKSHVIEEAIRRFLED